MTKMLDIILSLKRNEVKKMTTSLMSLTIDELEDKVLDLAEEYEVVDEGSSGFKASVNGEWLNDSFDTEEDAYRALISHLTNK